MNTQINKEQVIRVANKITCTPPPALKTNLFNYTLHDIHYCNASIYKTDTAKAVPNAMQEAFIKAVLN